MPAARTIISRSLPVTPKPTVWPSTKAMRWNGRSGAAPVRAASPGNMSTNWRGAPGERCSLLSCAVRAGVFRAGPEAGHRLAVQLALRRHVPGDHRLDPLARLGRGRDHPPDDPGGVVADEQGPGPVEGDPGGPAAGFAVACQEPAKHRYRHAARVTVGIEGHEDHVVARGRLAVPRTMAGYEGAVGVARPQPVAGRGKTQAKRGHMGAKGIFGLADIFVEVVRDRLFHPVVLLVLPVEPGPAVLHSHRHVGEIVRHEIAAEHV